MSDNVPIRPAVPDAAELKVWLEYQYSDAIREIVECRAALQSLLDKYPTGIPDDEVAGIAGENLAIVAAKLKALDERRLEENKPYRDGQGIVNNWFSDFVVGPVIETRAAVQAMQDRYGREKLRVAREAAEAKRLKAEEDARLAAEAAASAARAGREDAHGKMEQAGRAAEAAQKAAEQAEHVVTRIRGPMGAVSSSTVRWSWQVVDFAGVPDFYKTIDDGKIREAMRKRGPGGKPVAEIPGIRWVSDTTMRHR